MADLKISQLTAISVLTPATDVLPVVDVGGVTKKITTNQILASGGVASLASATITGAATVGTTLGVTGVSTFAAGTALLPALTTTGDTNTGIYYPAADTFAVTTGGTERLRVNSTGLGIGGSPASKLSLTDTSPTINFVTTSGLDVTGYISNAIDVGSGGKLVFGTKRNGNTALDAITIDSSQNVGIGVTPVSGQKLTVLTNIGISASTATAADDRLVFSENMGSVNLGSQIVWNNSSFSTPYASIGVSNGAAGSNGTLIFSTCSSIFTNTNTERVRIKPTGQVRFFPLAADPAGAETGDVYYNSVSNKLKCYNGTIWNDLF